MAKPLAVDNSKLREQARQKRQEQARLQQIPEKQPTKALFGPPIPVSRPNDPTFNKLSDCFGPYETGVYRPFFTPTNDTTSSEEGVTDRRSTDNARHHGDVARHNDNTRHGDNRHSNARHGDAARHADARQRDLRHGDNRNNDSRNSHTVDNASRNTSRGLGHGSAVLAPNADEALRQGVFEQFVKSNSNARDGSQVPSSDGRHSNKTLRNAKPPDLASGVKQSSTNDRMKNRSTALDRPRPERVEESVAPQTNCSVVSGPRPDGPKPGLPPSKSFSTPLQNSPPLLNHCSPFPNSSARDSKNSAWTHCGPDPSVDHEKTSRTANPSGRVNGSLRTGVTGSSKDVDMERRPRVIIPPLAEGHGKFDESRFFAALRKEVDIPPPVTDDLMTPKKTDNSTFPFPAVVLPEVSLCDQDGIIPKARLPEDEEDDEEEELRDAVLLSQPPVVPDDPASVSGDLELSSDSDNEQEKDPVLHHHRSPPLRPADMMAPDHLTDPKPNAALDSGKSRRMSESSVSSSEESCSSDSESDSSLSENEGEDATAKLNHDKDDEDDDNEDKQPKSWEIKNFIPLKSNEHVPFIPFISSSSSSPLVSRQKSHDDFDHDSDPLKQDRVLSPRLSPLPVGAPGTYHDLDDCDEFSEDITTFLSIGKDLPPSWGLPQIDITPPAPAAPTPTPTLIAGVDYCDVKPSVVVRICRSRLSASKVEVADPGVSVADPGDTWTNCRSATRTPTSSEHVGSKSEPIATDVRPPLSAMSSSTRTSAKRSSDTSPGVRTPAGMSQQPIACSPSVDSDPKGVRTEKSPRKVGSDRKDETYLSTAKGAKRKAPDDALCRTDQKKLCERSNSSSSGKEDRKSQILPTQNGDLGRAKGSRPPEPTNHVKSPALTASEDSSSRSSSSQKRSEKTKSQNGYSKVEEKPKKAAATPTTCPDGARSTALAPEPANVSVEKPGKAAMTPVANGVAESPAYASTFDAGEPGDIVSASRKRGAPCEDNDQPLDRRKEPVNGIKRPERWESSDLYLQQARRLKHEGDSGPDKFVKALSYIESVLAFVSHCSALEQEHAEMARIQKMYQDTMGLCQYIIRVIENVANAEKHVLLVISLRIQSVICLKLYYSRKLEIAKLKTVLDEHHKSHSTNAGMTGPSSWGHANGTPSPHSPRPSPSPAGSIGSVGSAGSSNGESAGGMGKPSSLMNGHSMTSIVVPQRIHSVMMNYLSHTNQLYQCHESWDQAESILATHSPVGEFFRSLDAEYGPIDLHSSTLAVVRYASEVVNRVRNNARRLSQATRAD